MTYELVAQIFFSAGIALLAHVALKHDKDLRQVRRDIDELRRMTRL